MKAPDGDVRRFFISVILLTYFPNRLVTLLVVLASKNDQSVAASMPVHRP